MNSLLRLSARMTAFGVAALLCLPVLADPNASGIFPAAAAPDARGRGYVPGRGMFLIASRRLVDPNFAESVVLLLEYDAKGALGLIVNRPTNVPLAELLPDVEELKERVDVVYLGGPVSKNNVVLLMRTQGHPPEAGRVFADTYVSSSMNTLKQAVAMSRQGGTFHAYVGYAGWGPGQLEGEVSRGDWHLSPADEAMVFDMASEKIWPQLIEKNSGQWVRRASPQLQLASGLP